MRRQQTTFDVHIFNINRFSAAVFIVVVVGHFCVHVAQQATKLLIYILNEE